VHANNSVITGAVYEDFYPYRPIPLIFIVCYNYYSGDYVAMGITQDDGSYRIELPPGEYAVYAQPEHESVYIPEYFGNTFDSFYAKKVTVSAGQTYGHIDFKLSIGGIIKGNVLYASDETPISFMRVEAYDEMGDLQGYTTSLDDGKYYLHVPEGKYKLRAYDTRNRNLVTVFYDENEKFIITDNFDGINAHMIEVEKGYITGYFNFFILEGIKVEGIVSDKNDMPINNAIVWAFSTNGNQFWTKTQPDGSYEIILPEASYWFYSESSSYLSQYYQDAVDVIYAQIITINDHMSGIDFQLKTENDIHYKLVDVIKMLQLLSGFSLDQSLPVSDYDPNKNRQVDMMDVLHVMHILI